jgi:uroporphyrinogen decarboxylase
MSVFVTDDQLKKAEEIVERTNDGGLDLDVEAFWNDQQCAMEDPWSSDCPQLPLKMVMSQECVFDELGIPEDWYRLYHDLDYKIENVHEYNNRAEKVVGRRLLSEERPNPEHAITGVKALHDIFEGENIWQNESYWLKEVAHSPDELSALLDRVDARLNHLRDFLLPADWEQQKTRVLNAGGHISLYRGQRGPVTFATSIYGSENLIYLIMDDESLANRFRDLIIKAILERARILDEEAGYDVASAPHGWYWYDDNCCLLNAPMYSSFGLPVLKAVFDRYSPDSGDMRGQHSDSDMGHLLPLLSKLGMTSVNLGPNISVTEIREHLPNAIIDGQLAPFTLSRNDEISIVAECLRDFDMSREKKGVMFATAGSINNGSRLSAMRLLMTTIQNVCRY